MRRGLQERVVLTPTNPPAMSALFTQFNAECNDIRTAVGHADNTAPRSELLSVSWDPAKEPAVLSGFWNGRESVTRPANLVQCVR